MPEIDVVLLNMPERGVIGIGEPATIPTAGAIANAVANALGVRVPSLPITPAKVLAALGKVPACDRHESLSIRHRRIRPTAPANSWPTTAPISPAATTCWA